MERVNNFTIILITIIGIIITLLATSIYNSNKEHNRLLEHAMKSKVEYYAKRCYLENNCEGNITLSVLYEKNYLDEVIDPVSKEVIDKDTSISFKDGVVYVNWLE